jgi:hypothetical protein
MRASLERTGGFAGLRLTSVADTDTLDADDAKRLQELIDEADFFKLPETVAPKKPQPDRFQYRLTVEDNKRKHTVNISEAAIPPNVRPLTDFLTRLARKG